MLTSHQFITQLFQKNATTSAMTWSTFVGSTSNVINTKSSSATSQRARAMSVGVAVRLNTLFTSVCQIPATNIFMVRKFWSVLSNTSDELEAPTRATMLFRVLPTSHPGETTPRVGKFINRSNTASSSAMGSGSCARSGTT